MSRAGLHSGCACCGAAAALADGVWVPRCHCDMTAWRCPACTKCAQHHHPQCTPAFRQQVAQALAALRQAQGVEGTGVVDLHSRGVI